ncbi:S1 RNA binding domain protein [Synechococcus sp. PCC 7335]|uniref:Tex family protein n=1 Tax=Synechococcus sp. (strain ATCC 29403 / PCC 7335) TaxID=91464 RepID=UPI00017EB0E9|nr:Tex family protein [Synechococcus sp. PCC 7335]EDX86682.1 S1 RNA binding domain protein [Synechococcus sp. PCC 7335]
MNAAQLIAQELSVQTTQVEAALSLFSEGATVPFIARYRKERTGELDEIQLRQIAERYDYLTELADRKQTILEVIAKQDRLTPSLKAKIEGSQSKTELEDLYLPYKPKRRTRATIAKEQGLAPLAQAISRLNQSAQSVTDLEVIAKPYLCDEVPTTDAALKGAADILAETMAEQASLRAYVRQFFLSKGLFTSKIKSTHLEGTTKYEMYRSYQRPVSKIASHNLLALLRGDKEGILKLSLSFDEDEILAYLLKSQLRTSDRTLRDFYAQWVKDGFNRLMKTALTNEVIAEKKAQADEESIQTFAENLRHLLLAAPAGMKPTIGIDPGFRTGCKVAAISETGQFLEYEAIYPHSGEGQRAKAITTLTRLISTHNIELIAIGNGTASRETDEFVAEVLTPLDKPPVKVMVSESGASIYSASESAIAEFPDLDITVRGAISIGRRLQDPLAELVKLDPKSIGVGQYQHDVDQKRLKQKLDDTVESCVNYVGVDLNTASKELLQYVSGVSSTVANNIVSFRDENGRFRDRKSLLKVGKLGPKAYEQAAGFLRIRDGDNPLDNTAVHPESYGLVKTMAKDLQLPLKDIPQAGEKLKQLSLKRYVSEKVGEPTLRDILSELEKPGRDPRAQFTYAQFATGVNEISDLRSGMVLEGVVTNVANFGAFVDIGVHQDGLVHVSQMSDRYVSDPKEIVQVGQVVNVQVMEVQEKLKRIGLSMRLDGNGQASKSTRQQANTGQVDNSVKSSNSAVRTNSAVRNSAVEKPIPRKKTDAHQPKTRQQKKSNQSTFNPEDLKNRFNRRRP